jgi:hypothetical protein
VDNSRRRLLQAIGAILASAPFQNTLAALTSAAETSDSNFQYIYANALYKEEFYNFLKNVFHLYPEDEMHRQIALASMQYPTDRTIYGSVQNDIPEIKPPLSELSYAIPALNKQKQLIAGQTSTLLDSEKRYEGYLELGSTGRYLDALEEQLDIVGDMHFISERPATYSPVDMIDRGQVFKAGAFTSLNNYRPEIAQNIPANSIDLVTVYIGFHHCPVELREQFIGSIRDVMSADGILILRDHDAHNEKMSRMVALAHDVFNMGTNESWAYNDAELRNFYSLIELDKMLTQYGFKSEGTRLFQDGDPTRNALMRYIKA